MEKIFTEKEERYLKGYFRKKDAVLGVSENTSATLRASFATKLDELAQGKQRKAPSWKLFIASLFSAFSLGAVVANLAIAPTVLVGTRSIDGVSSKMGDASTRQEFARQSAGTIIGDNLRLPGSSSNWLQIVKLASKSADELVIENLNPGLRLRIFIPNNQGEDTQALRVALGLPPEAYGWVTIVFIKNL